ncbi:hypothetical protein BESB_044310 [Besnoitia besnoiti]|uniref:EF-hand domain-containing protein n=1 Tax=Besnoitia besnoiti TaxID=94643 RepID=A0A2A9MED6_BESBE|nr:hypothetical protein BESB_044310 [Besnoitia besnoiti]PFH36239.1 hypothetical protein BESB_044310 [Besnoitia besnoiti]
MKASAASAAKRLTASLPCFASSREVPRTFRSGICQRSHVSGFPPQSRARQAGVALRPLFKRFPSRHSPSHSFMLSAFYSLSRSPLASRLSSSACLPSPLESLPSSSPLPSVAPPSSRLVSSAFRRVPSPLKICARDQCLAHLPLTAAFADIPCARAGPLSGAVASSPPDRLRPSGTVTREQGTLLRAGSLASVGVAVGSHARRGFASERPAREREGPQEDETSCLPPQVHDDESLTLMQQMAEAFNQRPCRSRRTAQPQAVHVVGDLALSPSVTTSSFVPTFAASASASSPPSPRAADNRRESDVASGAEAADQNPGSSGDDWASALAEPRASGGAHPSAPASSSGRPSGESQEANWGRSKARDEMPQDGTEELVVVDLEKLRRDSKLVFLPVQTVLRTLVDTYPGMYVWRDGFVHTVKQLLAAAGLVSPSQRVSDEVLHQAFDFLDKSNNEIIDLLEAVRGLPQLCRASHDDRIKALFELFDRRGCRRLHFDEVMEVFCFIYRVILTPSVVSQLKEASLDFTTIDDIALHTTRQLFSHLRRASALPLQPSRASIAFKYGFPSRAAPSETSPASRSATAAEGSSREKLSSAPSASYFASSRRPATPLDAWEGRERRCERGDENREAKTREIAATEEGPWKQALQRRDEFISYKDFKEICATLPPSVGFSKASLLELPLILLVRDVLAPLRSHVVIRRRRSASRGSFASN